MKHALVPWNFESEDVAKEGRELKEWKGDWQFAVEVSAGGSISQGPR